MAIRKLTPTTPGRRGMTVLDKSEITRQSPQQIVDRLLELPEKTRFQVLAPVLRESFGAANMRPMA